jgi:hypothetical protein
MRLHIEAKNINASIGASATTAGVRHCEKAKPAPRGYGPSAQSRIEKGKIMKLPQAFVRAWVAALILLLALPPGIVAQQADQGAPIRQEELDQLLAPIALYPDALISQILMAATYPLDVVNAARFAKQNANLKGDALTKSLEAQSWDPSVKSLVNFPQVLTMMNDKLDWTQKLGDAFLANEKPVMDTIQSLRAKAQAAGNLKTTNEQKVVVQDKYIVIEPASPQVVYVPTYNPTVVYGAWPYPAYPPYYYYPPGYVAARSMFWWGSAVAMGAAWGYAWGSPNWSNGSVKYNYNQNININNNINRNVYANQQPANAQGNWQHNAANRKGVPYSNQSVQQRYNQASPSQQVQARQAYRGYTGSALTPNEQQQAQQRAQQAQQQKTGQQAQQARQQQSTQQGQQQRAQQAQQQPARQTQQARPTTGAGSGGGASQSSANRGTTSNRGGAFEGVDRGSSATKNASQRGSASRSSSGGGGSRSGASGSRSGGGGGRR